MEIHLDEDELRGTFRVPDGSGPFPGVLALGGSDGGTPEYLLELLVPEGFACLALAYWGTPETQLVFADVPLERVERGLRWLAGRAEVASADGRVALLGASRGAELALLVAATWPQLVGPVAAYSPSSVAWVGVDPRLPPGRTRSSWTLGGAPLAYLRFPEGAVPARSERGISMLPLCEGGLRNRPAAERAAIAVERCRGPLLLVSGGDDRVWPAARMCETIVERLSRHGRGDRVRHLHYPAAGHILFPYARPPDTRVPHIAVDFGGTPEANRQAHCAVWPEIVRHLRANDAG